MTAEYVLTLTEFAESDIMAAGVWLCERGPVADLTVGA
jgi:hypothetical protein